MALDPDLEGFLELAQLGRLSGKTRPMHELSVAQARSEFELTSGMLDSAPPSDLVVRDLHVQGRDGHLLPVRLYRCGGDSIQPGILYFHGGGNVVGSLDSHDAVCRRLAFGGRQAVVSVGYRLAPEHVHPAASNDAVDVAQWLAEQAAGLGIDACAVSVAGDSAGATLACVVSMSAQRGECRLLPAAQLLFYPVADISRERPSHDQYEEGYLLERDTLRWFYRQYCPDEQQRTDWRLSPLLADFATPQVRTFISLAEFDPLFDEGMALAQRLQEAGTQVTLRVEHGFTHDFLRMSGISSRVSDIYAAVDDWLNP
ncbi:alpha/beta hydrolase [Pseudomonas monteilii]|uniref:alpha/beta hydrolase n=1 Tax=Pseudomonas monteilii TaxID=76759 RepID=UPI00381A858C